MASDNLDLALRIRADLKSALRQLDQFDKGLDQSGKRARRASRDLGTLDGAANKLRNTMAAVASALLLREIVQAADTYTNLRSQLRLVTDSQEDLNSAWEANYALAQETRQGLAPTVNLYARLARATEELDLNQQQLLTVTRAINQSFIVSGASAQEAASSTLQLSQGIASGTLRGEELNSVLENSPRLARAIAQGLGVTIGELRELGQEGQLTGEAVTKALLRTADTINDDFQNMERTVGQALQQLRNDLVVTFGQTDTTGFVDSIDELRTIVTDPQFQKSVVALGTAFATLVGWLAKGTTEGVAFTRWLGEELAAKINGIAANDIPRLEQRLAGLRKNLDPDTPFLELDVGLVFTSDDEIKRQIAETEAQLKRAYESQELARKLGQSSSSDDKDDDDDDDGKPLLGGGNDKEAEKRLKRQRKFVEALEREAELYEASDAAVRQYEIAQQGLTGKLLERAEAANKALTEQEKLTQATKDAAALNDIQNQLLEGQGRGAEAVGAELEAEYADLLKRLKARGDDAGVDLINSLINVEVASARLQELQGQIDRVFAAQSRQESRIQAQQEAGVISELNAREQLVELHRATADQVDELLPKMQQLAEVTGDKAALERVKDLRAEMQNLRLVTNQFATTLRDSFEEGLADGLQKLAKGTQDLEDTVRGVAQAIADAMLQLAAQNLAQMATQGLSNLLTGGAKAGAETAAAAAGAATMAGAITSASAVGGSTIAGSMTAAAVVAGQTIAGAMTAASVGGVAGGFAEGGWTGPGTKYTVAGVVHAGEYVQPAHVMRQPGAMGFMESFRRQGMAALNGFRGYANGGLVQPSPAIMESPAATLAANIPPAQLKQRLLPILSDDVVADALRGPAGEEMLELHISRNPSKFNQLIKGGG
ncbi:MAG: hypothetical protein CL543_09010 [Alcanivorax sp.]|nr:hypothetical protein [Alcanivorax sp.]